MAKQPRPYISRINRHNSSGKYGITLTDRDYPLEHASDFPYDSPDDARAIGEPKCAAELQERRGRRAARIAEHERLRAEVLHHRAELEGLPDHEAYVVFYGTVALCFDSKPNEAGFFYRPCYEWEATRFSRELAERAAQSIESLGKAPCVATHVTHALDARVAELDMLIEALKRGLQPFLVMLLADVLDVVSIVPAIPVIA